MKQIQRIWYSEQCPKCQREIIGYTEDMMRFNLGLHLDGHKRWTAKKKRPAAKKNERSADHTPSSPATIVDAEVTNNGNQRRDK